MRGLLAVVPFIAGCDVLFQLQHVDPPRSEPPDVIAQATGNCIDCTTTTLSFKALAGRPSNLLLVGVAVSGGSAAPAIVSVTYGADPLSFLRRSVAASAPSHPLLETWQLANPPPGTASLTVTVGGTAAAIVVGVTQIEGTSAVEPVRASAGASSMTVGKQADNVVDSADLDLVIDSVCSGTSIDAPGLTQTVLYVQNQSDAFACGNLGSSVAGGGAPSVPIHWDVNANLADHWIDLASSIAPGP